MDFGIGLASGRLLLVVVPSMAMFQSESSIKLLEIDCNPLDGTQSGTICEVKKGRRLRFLEEDCVDVQKIMPTDESSPWT